MSQLLGLAELVAFVDTKRLQMGAMLYFHVTPFTVPADALLAIQADVLETQYDLDTLVQTQLEQAKAALDEIDEEDEYGLRDEFEEQVQFLESLATLPIPANPRDRIAYVKAVYQFDECGMGNILDVRGVADTPELFMAGPADLRTIAQVIGNERPKREDVEKIASAIHETLGRGECVYFSIFTDGESKPSALCFVGNTVD